MRVVWPRLSLRDTAVKAGAFFSKQLNNQLTARWLAINEIEVFNQPAADHEVRYGYQQIRLVARCHQSL